METGKFVADTQRAKQVYSALRTNLVRTLYREYTQGCVASPAQLHARTRARADAFASSCPSRGLPQGLSVGELQPGHGQGPRLAPVHRLERARAAHHGRNLLDNVFVQYFYTLYRTPPHASVRLGAPYLKVAC